MQLFTGKEYLKIDIANSFGVDKESWDQRIKWFNDNENNLFDLIKDADEPAMFFAGITAYDEMSRGNPIGYPISLDATASGLQILAALTGDRNAAQLCNVVDSGFRADAYNIVYGIMTQKVNDVSKIHRDDTKRAIMTLTI